MVLRLGGGLSRERQDGLWAGRLVGNLSLDMALRLGREHREPSQVAREDSDEALLVVVVRRQAVGPLPLAERVDEGLRRDVGGGRGSVS